MRSPAKAAAAWKVQLLVGCTCGWLGAVAVRRPPAVCCPRLPPQAEHCCNPGIHPLEPCALCNQGSWCCHTDPLLHLLHHPPHPAPGGRMRRSLMPSPILSRPRTSCWWRRPRTPRARAQQPRWRRCGRRWRRWCCTAPWRQRGSCSLRSGYGRGGTARPTSTKSARGKDCVGGAERVDRKVVMWGGRVRRS